MLCHRGFFDSLLPFVSQRSAEECTKIKNARARRAEIFVFLFIKYADLRFFSSVIAYDPHSCDSYLNRSGSKLLTLLQSSVFNWELLHCKDDVNPSNENIISKQNFTSLRSFFDPSKSFCMINMC